MNHVIHFMGIVIVGQPLPRRFPLANAKKRIPPNSGLAENGISQYK